MKAAEALRAVLQGERLSQAQMCALFLHELGGELDTHALAGLLVALSMRGETAAEIAGAAEALRALMLPFEHAAPAPIDTCGTGGDGLSSFNLSTAAALVACAAGATVIKHGNRGLSSRCGSADLLEQGGLVLELSPRAARLCLEEVGIVFLFAPAWHPALRQVGPLRKALGVRTLFNFLGPLCNPGRVRRQLLGVPRAERLADFAAALQALGHERALMVHGGGGANELTLEPGNRAAVIGAQAAPLLEAEALGLRSAPVSALRGGDARENQASFERLLAGENGPLRDAVLLNAAAALWVSGQAQESAHALQLARAALDSGRAKAKLAHWVRVTQSLRGSA